MSWTRGMSPGLANRREEIYPKRRPHAHARGCVLGRTSRPRVAWVRMAKSGSCLAVSTSRRLSTRIETSLIVPGAFLSGRGGGGQPSLRIPLCGDLGTDTFNDLSIPGGRPTRDRQDPGWWSGLRLPRLYRLYRRGRDEGPFSLALPTRPRKAEEALGG